MKLQLDTKNKTIKVQESEVILEDLIATLETLLPDGKWKEFILETNTTQITWTNPFYIEPYRTPIGYPWPNYPWITCENSDNMQYHVNVGTYNIET